MNNSILNLYGFRALVVSIAFGMFLPSIVGLGVKFYLMRIGKPTVSMSFILNPGSLVAFTIISLISALPFIYFGNVAKSEIYNKSKFTDFTILERHILTYIPLFLGGMIGVVGFINVFWVLDMGSFYIFWFTLFGMAFTLYFGFLLTYAILIIIKKWNLVK